MCSLTEKILYISNMEYKFFLNKANVIGVGLGYKIKNGFCYYKECIKIFVTKKIAENKLSDNDLVPKCFKGIETDVNEIGFQSMYSLRDRKRPVTGGYNISPTIGAESGTLGCIVTDGKYYYVLSNNHILASNGKTPINCPIIQPSRKYKGKDPNDIIANLSKYIIIKKSTPTEVEENFVDCAIAKITRRSYISTKITFLGRIKGTKAPRLYEKVQKVGCTTELTQGQISSIGTTIITDIMEEQTLFKNQIITNKMASGGDSGSILLDKNMNAIGLLMSGGSSSNTYNPISAVLDSLNVKIVVG
ncbi:hypothetical protein [Clostridium botulinum]|uniref:Nal1 N-terminal domain-containing protein n=1 Tax=Clostridium botulinum TaxID=1491 RepID=A0A9Q1UZ43_CLOBO|nr:hypothetical protein [Clostridium botulinum]AEB75584.1 hypothetical protein CbC4_0904 [Clostridium botulinum BKT015925]KEI04313.1 hypothetical protein Y848_02110 [Clostridium botulinum C/D str. Sp77]KLU75265.1 hypothetical protein CBC3_09745 [Clostridium botulinum V891]KOA76587.1 hypothetical protein ADU77_08970 [Clostridium botulinum]KOA78481.1 hypothetical protein ADU78_01785 [Clostridium botulinum]